MKVVLDTNVLVSGLINPHGPPGRIIDLMWSGELALMVDDRIIEEYANVLRRDYFRRYFNADETEHVIEFLRHDAIRITCGEIVHGLPDLGDVPFVETALTASVPLVTGNARHFPVALIRGCVILSPAQLMKVFADRCPQKL